MSVVNNLQSVSRGLSPNRYLLFFSRLSIFYRAENIFFTPSSYAFWLAANPVL